MISFGLIGATAFAESSEQAYMKSYAGVTDMPVPIKVVSPDITTVRGAEVILEFVINENGVPQAIAVAKSNDSELAEAAMRPSPSGASHRFSKMEKWFHRRFVCP